MNTENIDRLLDFSDAFVHTRKMSIPARKEINELKHTISELLAVINRDGGHAEQEDPDVIKHSIERVIVLNELSDSIEAQL